MSEPIRNKKLDSISAPTPQNTPSTAAPISSRAQQPGVASIQEENIAGLASNPAVIAMMQNRLQSLVGQSSGYIESLPASVRRRVAGLKGLQLQHSKLEAEFQDEVLQLEKKYFGKFSPLYEKRARVVNGHVEPSDDEVTAGEKKDQEAAEAKAEAGDADDDDAKAAAPQPNQDPGTNISGIPEFWLSAMKNNVSLAEMITDRDEHALKHLDNIRMEYLDRPGFRLIFDFSENPFFTNQTLTKTYLYREENGYGGDFIYDHAEGDTVQWKADKDLTVRIESKKQRNKNTKQTRIVKKTVPTESFFNFFSPPKAPSGDESVTSDIEERLELDYQLGEDIKEKLIPRAIDWFTGEALQYEGLEVHDDPDEDDDVVTFDELSDLDERDEDDDSGDEDDGGRPKQEAAECKQS